MYNQLKNIMTEALYILFKGEDVTPVGSSFFQVDESLDKLKEETSDYFH